VRVVHDAWKKGPCNEIKGKNERGKVSGAMDGDVARGCRQVSVKGGQWQRDGVWNQRYIREMVGKCKRWLEMGWFKRWWAEGSETRLSDHQSSAAEE
jgi:hypothetical protein